MPSTNKQLLECVDKLLTPLARSRGLELNICESSATHAVVETIGGPLKVRLEYDRGLLSFQISATEAESMFWEVDLVAELFPRLRRIPFGTQRLTLEEQAAFISSNWDELCSMFSPDNYSSTHSALMRQE